MYVELLTIVKDNLSLPSLFASLSWFFLNKTSMNRLKFQAANKGNTSNSFVK